MSRTPPTPNKQSNPIRTKSMNLRRRDISDTTSKISEYHHASAFVTWYRNMIDNERQNFSLYLSDDATLEWFGRTIKTRRKIAAFFNHSMQCSRHDFTTVEIIEKIQSRQESIQRRDDSILASPLRSPDLTHSKPTKRKQLKCNSPQWAEGSQPDNESMDVRRKKLKTSHTESIKIESNCENQNYNVCGTIQDGVGNGIGNNGDCGKEKGKGVLVTPPNLEIGQGDCHPSTSGTDSDKSHEALTAQLPKLAVQCNGFIEFTRTRNSRSIDSMKWERKCKVQISFSNDPLNIGEYIIWAIQYHDENKCRRNLLEAFEKASKEV